MSVLLDALKKAAEDKKNADKVIIESDQDISYSESFKDSQDNSNLDVKLAVPGNKCSNTDSSEESIDEDVKGSIDVNKTLVLPELELSKSSLNLLGEADPEEFNLSSADFKIKLQSEDTLKTQEEPETLGNDLTSLNASKDTEDSALENKAGLQMTESSNANTLSRLSMEKQTEADLDSVEQKQNINDKKNQNSDYFNWSMDDLPGYETQNKIHDSKTQQSNKFSQNPILINGGNTPPKTNNKYATSTKLFVSLVVVLLFVGIGFYGVIYYQAQNEDLESSMREYNLTMMQFTQPKATFEKNKVQQEPFEDTTVLNNVTDKVISLDSSIDGTVTDQVNDDSSAQVALSTSLSITEAVVSGELPGKNPSKSMIEKSELGQLVGQRNIKYTGSEKPVIKLGNIPTNSSISADSSAIIKTVRSSISKAYSAYELGRFDQAHKMFTEALAKEPSNINALLGLGGLAVVEGNNEFALGYYQRVLDEEPDNIYAFESIANLSGKMTLNEAWENELFEMSHNHPGSAVFQYAKGNILAKKTDWLAAQESYFNAYALDSSNSVYMVNLAVCYDHLGKYELAAHYYTKALGFASGSNTSFDKKHVRDRLVSLRQFISQGH